MDFIFYILHFKIFYRILNLNLKKNKNKKTQSTRAETNFFVSLKIKTKK